MLEGKSYLVSRSLPSSCEPETEWAYLAHEVLSGKRPAPEDVEVEDLDEADGGGKRSKPPSPQPHTPDISEGHGSSRHASGCGEQQGTGSNPMNSIGRDLTINSSSGYPGPTTARWPPSAGTSAPWSAVGRSTACGARLGWPSIGSTSPAMFLNGMPMTHIESAGSKCPRCRLMNASCALTRNHLQWVLNCLCLGWRVLCSDTAS